MTLRQRQSGRNPRKIVPLPLHGHHLCIGMENRRVRFSAAFARPATAAVLA
eukprot:CAMPEP_0171331308 /NCGR_PEP_ID=MMETSP0878-20121228/2604_1 /TAXON_ID=67004 /ORGANISM="Thalassiosira weissflogii, Strain CCMP1336" /LENGTH=50 /DNA_ID=CAMNT_0011831811 /DNA_START=346 /DNA_END=498 /DNA_ORIENTATION=+